MRHLIDRIKLKIRIYELHYIDIIRKMKSLIQLVNQLGRSQSIQDEIVNILDLKKLSNATLLRISDTSLLTSEESSQVFGDIDDNQIIAVLKKMIFDPISPLSAQDLKLIKFERYSDYVQQNCLGLMLTNNLSTDKICILLDCMQSVNYGNHPSFVGGFHSLNPLMHCCQKNKFDIVKLLVENYRANIEHVSLYNATAIMFSAQSGNIPITQYLYNKGARLSTVSRHISEFATDSIKEVIAKWKTDMRTQYSEIKNDLDQIKADYEKLKAENLQMKLNYENILSLQNNLNKNGLNLDTEYNGIASSADSQLKLNYHY